MRLPFSITSISSPGRPRKEGDRTRLEASEMEFCPTMNDGTRLDRVSSILPVGWAARSEPLNMSMGAEDSAAVRSVRRVPVTMTSPSSLAASLGASAAAALAVPPFIAPARTRAAPNVSVVFIRISLDFDLLDHPTRSALSSSLRVPLLQSVSHFSGCDPQSIASLLYKDRVSPCLAPTPVPDILYWALYRVTQQGGNQVEDIR